MRLALLLALGCANPAPSKPRPAGENEPAFDPSANGPYVPAHTRLHLHDAARDRELRVEAWYPASGGALGLAVPDAFFTDPAEIELYAALLEAAPEGCPSTVTAAARETIPASLGPRPLVLFSHCHECMRFSSFTVAERLASHGVLVLAPDHAGNTLLDRQRGEGLPLDEETLELRRADLAFLLDEALDGPLVEGLEVDPDRVGVLGHSFGSVTAGALAQEDERVRAVMGMAAPMENPLLPGVSMEALDLPLLLLVAQEDNSISEAGNALIRSNFEAAPGPAWKVEVEDAGHWSFSDLCGLVEGFLPGCGEDVRQTVPGETFTYLPAEEGRQVAATVAAAFFAEQLLDEEGALEQLPEPSIEARP